MRDEELQKRTLLRPREASALFGVPLATIYIWYHLGKIDGVNVNGRSLRIFSKSLQELLKSRTRKKGKPERGLPQVEAPDSGQHHPESTTTRDRDRRYRHAASMTNGDRKGHS
jgi:excisionase family DNA binding protein